MLFRATGECFYTLHLINFLFNILNNDIDLLDTIFIRLLLRRLFLQAARSRIAVISPIHVALKLVLERRRVLVIDGNMLRAVYNALL